jgi:hypothetical protein
MKKLCKNIILATAILTFSSATFAEGYSYSYPTYDRTGCGAQETSYEYPFKIMCEAARKLYMGMGAYKEKGNSDCGAVSECAEN